MAMRPVPSTPSTNIAMVEYDDETQEMLIYFQKGGIYKYYQVPANIAEGFGTAPSATVYMNTYVHGVYPEERIV